MADTSTTETQLGTSSSSSSTSSSSSSTDTTAATNTGPTGGTGGGKETFCGSEARVSTHTCNSLDPAVTLDTFGNEGIVWMDNRDGNFEIYFRMLASRMSAEEGNDAKNAVYDPKTGRYTNVSCKPADDSGPSGVKGFSATSFRLDDRASGIEGFSGVVARRPGGRLDVNPTIPAIFLTSDDGSTDFQKIGVVTGSNVRIETGKNVNFQFVVQSIISPRTLQLSYLPQAVNDANFMYSIIDNPKSVIATNEIRLTCSKGASMFPDIVSDANCRFHVLYHDDKSGKNKIYYVQVAPKDKMSKSCPPGLPPRAGYGFGEVPAGSRNTYRFYSASQQVVKYFAKTGTDGQLFAYGNRLLPDPESIGSGSTSNQTGIHTLYRDFENHGGQWIGLSSGADRQAWNEEISSNPVAPDVVITETDALSTAGDFGGAMTFSYLSFLVQSPPDKGVDLQTIALPIKPRCAPFIPQADTSNPKTSALVEAPVRPLPPTFIDPIDLSSFLNSPLVKVTDEPARFTVDDDASGTVFTNILVEDASGELSRLLFRKVEDGRSYKFVLGMSKCGDGLCAVRPVVATATDPDAELTYNIKLQIWKGSDFRIDATQLDSASMAAEKVYEKTFTFDAGDEMSAFSFEPGEVTLDKGHIYFFVPIPGDTVDFMVKGVGGGNALWTTDATGMMTQYNVPFTLPPYKGLTVPVYYDGYLLPQEDPALPAETSVVSDLFTVTQHPEIGIGSLVSVDTHFNSPIGIDYSPELNALIASSNYPSGSPFSLESIDGEGNHAPYGVGLTNITDEIMIAVTRPLYAGELEDGKGFDLGTTFVGNGQPGEIVKISPTGTVTNPWVTLPGAGLLRGGLHVDRTGVWDGDLLVCTSEVPTGFGTIWRVKPDGSASLLASMPFHLESIITIPKDEDKYGPLAGCVVAGAETQGSIVAVGLNGSITTYNVGINVESMVICEPDSNLYSIAFSENTMYGLHADDLVDYVGDLLFAQEFPGILFHVKWDGSTFVANEIARTGQFEQIAMAPIGVANIPDPTVQAAPDETPTGGPCGGDLYGTYPKALTSGNWEDQYPRMAITPRGSIWAVWQSDRNGSPDIYAARYFGQCNVWNSSGYGGDDIRVSNFSDNNSRAMFPKVAVNRRGEAHVVFQALDADGKYEIYYAKSTGGGTAFTKPIRITSSPGDALMPDIVITYEEGQERITVVWHDNRYGNFEIMSAYKSRGKWRSSFQDGSDLRITNSKGNSLFPRLAADKDSNIRMVYSSSRTGRDETFMSTFIGQTRKWSSSAQGAKDIKISTGPLNSRHPDVDVDKTGGIAIVWDDDRHVKENPDLHEEIYSTYCPKVGHPGAHFPPINTDIEARIDFEFNIVNCVDYQPVSYTNVPEVCLKIKAPGATFWRGSNGDGQFSDWQSFKPTFDLDTTIVPWTLACGNGVKNVCIQIQDTDTVSFPLCRNVALAVPPKEFKVEMYSDEALTIPLPKFNELPAAKSGDIFVKITAPEPQVVPPTFSVIGRGGHIITNQGTTSIAGTSGFSGFSGTAGIGSFVGAAAGSSFSASASPQFKGRFHVHREDGLFHIDGLARVVVRAEGVCPDNAQPADQVQSVKPCPDEAGVPAGITPPDYTGTSGFSSPSGSSTGPWNASDASMYMTIGLDSGDIAITPPISELPYVFNVGAIAQPFILVSDVTGDVTITMKLARRAVPGWLSSFETRKVKVDIIKDFLSMTPSIIASKYVSATELPEVNFDPVTSLMVDPYSLEAVDSVSFTLTGVALLAGVSYAISLTDDTFYPLLGTYGANTRYFVAGIGTTQFSGAQVYYTRDY